MTLLRNALPGSDRENVRQTQGLATHLNPLRQIPNRLPLCNCSRSSRYLLVMSPDPSTLSEFAGPLQLRFADLLGAVGNPREDTHT